MGTDIERDSGSGMAVAGNKGSSCIGLFPPCCRQSGEAGVVPAAGVEPARPCGQGILSPSCLPAPPRGHGPDPERMAAGGAAVNLTGRASARGAGSPPGHHRSTNALSAPCGERRERLPSSLPRLPKRKSGRTEGRGIGGSRPAAAARPREASTGWKKADWGAAACPVNRARDARRRLRRRIFFRTSIMHHVLRSCTRGAA